MNQTNPIIQNEALVVLVHTNDIFLLPYDRVFFKTKNQNIKLQFICITDTILNIQYMIAIYSIYLLLT